MKKILLPILILSTLILAACGSTATSDSQSEFPADENASLSPQLELLLGTFKLEGTENAVTAEQAAELIPLWQAYKSLSQSDTAAQEEIDALVQQIKDTLTPKQIEAIRTMKLTGQDMFTLMQEKGIMSGFGDRGGISGTPQPGQMPGGFVPGQGVPPEGFNRGQGGGFVPGQGGSSGGQGFTPEQMATAQASRSQQAMNANRIPTALFDALNELLESK